ncbi:hypothetical protein KEM52_000249 [Ascosphaera acerosa]|nr:hypothetical protein KEM52_000249 [Ascosphaera acerosa]
MALQTPVQDRAAGDAAAAATMPGTANHLEQSNAIVEPSRAAGDGGTGAGTGTGTASGEGTAVGAVIAAASPTNGDHRLLRIGIGNGNASANDLLALPSAATPASSSLSLPLRETQSESGLRSSLSLSLGLGVELHKRHRDQSPAPRRISSRSIPLSQPASLDDFPADSPAATTESPKRLSSLRRKKSEKSPKCAGKSPPSSHRSSLSLRMTSSGPRIDGQSQGLSLSTGSGSLHKSRAVTNPAVGTGSSSTISTVIEDGDAGSSRNGGSSALAKSTTSHSRSRAIARFFLPGRHHHHNRVKSPLSNSTSVAASHLSQSAQQGRQGPSPSPATAATAKSPLPPPHPPSSARLKSLTRTDTTRSATEMFGANFVHPSTVDYLTSGYSPGGAPAYATQTPGSIQNHIHTTAAKRILSLHYLQDTYDSNVHWYNTVHMTRIDMSRMPYFEGAKLTVRANQYLVLGLSLPMILDPSNDSVLEYLRSLNALLLEFEAFQQSRPPPSSSSGGPAAATVTSVAASSASLAPSKIMKLPTMFKWTGGHGGQQPGIEERPGASGTSMGNGKRRASSATTMDWSTQDESHQQQQQQQQQDRQNTYLIAGSGSGTGARGGSTTTLATDAAASANLSGSLAHPESGPTHQPTKPANSVSKGPLAPTTQGLGVSDQYTYLLMPSVPFEPDFFQTFGALCDVLADAYERLVELTGTMNLCTPLVGELFVKADAKIKRLMLGTPIKEFEEASRKLVRNELQGVTRVILAGS